MAAAAVTSLFVAMALSSFHALEWRLDVEVGSRSTASTVKPQYIVRLDTTDAAGENVSSTHLTSDFANMERLRVSLEAALAELAKPHAKRIVRYIR